MMKRLIIGVSTLLLGILLITDCGRVPDSKTITTSAENKTENKTDANAAAKKTEKKSDGSFVLILILTIMLIALISIPLGFIHFNVFGAGETLRPYIGTNSIFRKVLPAVNNPEDPKNMNRDQLTALIDSQKSKISDLEANLKQMKNISEDYTGSADGFEKLDADKRQLNQESEQLEKDEHQLEKTKLAFAEQVKNSDTKSFKEYYQSMNADTAKKMYEEILREDKANAEIKEFVSFYEKMDPVYAAKIFEQVASTQPTLVANMISYMDKNKASKILQEMDVKTAGKITDILAKKSPILN
jgi:flagellar motility protein MotE (MotC chaperone)